MARINLSHNHPMPEPQRGVSGESKYPFLQMQVGDSFFIPLDPGRTLAQLRNAIGSAAYFAPSKPGMSGAKFSTRKTVENGVTGIRCWRIT